MGMETNKIHDFWVILSYSNKENHKKYPVTDSGSSRQLYF